MVRAETSIFSDLIVATIPPIEAVPQFEVHGTPDQEKDSRNSARRANGGRKNRLHRYRHGCLIIKKGVIR
jgi:hypothetical protein